MQNLLCKCIEQVRLHKFCIMVARSYRHICESSGTSKKLKLQFQYTSKSEIIVFHSCCLSAGIVLNPQAPPHSKWQQKQLLVDFLEVSCVRSTMCLIHISPVWFVGVYQPLVRNTTAHKMIFHLEQWCTNTVFCRNLCHIQGTRRKCRVLWVF